ncbi:MAG: TVP38/TMEM64 family protein [Methylocystaceae bacterium]
MINKKTQIIIYAGVGIILLGLMIYFTITLVPDIRKLVGDSEHFKAYLLSFGPFAAGVFILLQIIQVVLPAVPGELLQFAGGYVFGIWRGTLYNVVGIFLGSTIAFLLARLIGLPLVRYLVPEQQLQRFDFVFRSRKADLIIIVLFFIPGLPKDFLTYIAGLTPVHPVTFLLITTIARFPANFAATYMGANLIRGNTNMVVLLVAAALILLIAAYLFRQRIMDYLRQLG